MTCQAETPRVKTPARGRNYVGPMVTLEQLCVLVSQVSGAHTSQCPSQIQELHDLLMKCFDIDSLQRPSFSLICTQMAPQGLEEGLGLNIRDARVCELEACANPAQQFKVAGVRKQWLLRPSFLPEPQLPLLQDDDEAAGCCSLRIKSSNISGTSSSDHGVHDSKPFRQCEVMAAAGRGNSTVLAEPSWLQKGDPQQKDEISQAIEHDG